MVTHIKQVQIIVSLLKQYNIKHFVISPGTRHVPLVHALEIDPYFKCYSVVDERSAAYVALGIAEIISAPVCVSCTSATATCNYLPAIQEAFERNIPLIALTADRARYQRFHGENQCIDQVDMYRPFCHVSVDLPLVENENDYWFCNRSVNEVLIEVLKKKCPAQINYIEPISIRELSTFDVERIPQTRKINLIKDEIVWSNFARELKGKRILVVCGVLSGSKEGLVNSLKKFNLKYESVITTDYFANIRDASFIHSPGLDVALNRQEYQDLRPDIVISFGCKVYSGLGVVYRNCGIPHWYIDEEGHLYDPLRTLNNIFAVKPEEFFLRMASLGTGQNSFKYYRLWNEKKNRIIFHTPIFTNYVAIKRTIECLPNNSIVHASVLNGMRFTNFCILPEGCKYFGNLCTDGIDGALSTFLGHARCSNKICLLVIGDLSYLYDLNASFENIPNNVRILLVNNNAGGEFHYNIGKERIPTLNDYIAASHQNRFKETAEFANVDYECVSNIIDLDSALKTFFSYSNRGKILEVITNAEVDGKELRSMIRNNRIAMSVVWRIKDKLFRLFSKCFYQFF